MDTILHEKRLEIARCYVLAFTYAEIEEKASVSHGSVANIVKELNLLRLLVAR